MSMTIAADVFKGLLETAGIEINDSWKAILASKELSAQIPVADATQLTSKLLTVDAARNHPEVRKHLKGEFLGGIDTKIKSTLKNQFGLSEEDWKELRGNSDEGSITEKITPILDRLVEIGKAKGEKAGGGNVEELRTQIRQEEYKKFQKDVETHTATIQDLTTKLKTVSQEKTTIESESVSKMANLEKDFYIQNLLSGLPFSPTLAQNPAMKDIAIKTIKDSVNAEALLVKDGNDWKLKSPKDSAADYLTAENKTLTPLELIKVKAAQFLDPNFGKGTPAAGAGQEPKRPEGEAPKMPETKAFQFNGPANTLRGI